MPVIDADTHIDETEDTWEHVAPDEVHLKPEYRTARDLDPTRPGGHYWSFDGGLRQARRVRSDDGTGTTGETRELLDVDARLRQMDAVGTDIHVIYPTVFLTEFTDRPDLELAIKRSYNRWLGERTGSSAEARDRLRWVIVPPTRNLDAAIEEMRWGRAHGACGVLKKGNIEAGFWPAEEYFDPFYEEAQRLDLTVCFHLGGGEPDQTSRARFAHVAFMRTRAPVMNACDSIIRNRVTERFPRLRFAFVEAGASWLPNLTYMLQRQLTSVQRQADRLATTPGVAVSRGSGSDYQARANWLSDNRIFVTCLVDEDLPYIINCVGEDVLMAGSDYAHSDFSEEGHFASLLAERSRRGEVSESAVRKILWDNPKACYGL